MWLWQGRKSKRTKGNTKLSPKAYLTSGRARKLPVYECLVAAGWKEMGQSPVIVARQHVNGIITFANFLVDIFCTGVKDAFCQVNIEADDYQEIVEKSIPADMEMIKIEYNLAHNIIYEALSFAADYHIDPHPDFKLVGMVLAEDDESIPMIEITTGKDGKPLLVTNPDDDRANYYRKQLEKGQGN